MSWVRPGRYLGCENSVLYTEENSDEKFAFGLEATVRPDFMKAILRLYTSEDFGLSERNIVARITFSEPSALGNVARVAVRKSDYFSCLWTWTFCVSPFCS